jgi:hypothetical protein
MAGHTEDSLYFPVQPPIETSERALWIRVRKLWTYRVKFTSSVWHAKLLQFGFITLVIYCWI